MSEETIKVRVNECIVIDGKHAIFLTDEDIKEFNCAISWINKQMTRDEIIGFLAANIGLFYDGKQWGFDDTVVRESICKELGEENG